MLSCKRISDLDFRKIAKFQFIIGCNENNKNLFIMGHGRKGAACIGAGGLDGPQHHPGCGQLEEVPCHCIQAL